MNARTLGTPPSEGKKLKRTPLGRLRAEVWTGKQEPRAALREALGGEFGDRFADAYLMAQSLEPAARTRQQTAKASQRWPDSTKPGNGRKDAPRVTWRAERRPDTTPGFHSFVYFVLVLLERIGLESGKAVGSKLWLGDAWRRDALGNRVYTPSHQQKGLAGLVGVSVRELERYLALLDVAGLVKSWQPKKQGSARAPDDLPRWMRGATYAYQHYLLKIPMPKVLRAHLERWYKKHAPHSPPGDLAPAVEPTRAEPTRAEPAPLTDLMAGFEAIMAAARGRGPPPRPS